MQVFMYYTHFKNDWKIQKFFVRVLFSLCNEEFLIGRSSLLTKRSAGSRMVNLFDTLETRGLTLLFHCRVG